VNHAQAMARLYSLALFGPGVQGATFANVLLRAERALAGVSLSDERSLPLELAALRENLAQRQAALQCVHDALARPEPTHRQARGSRIAREQRDAENRGDPSEDPGR
jgi:hypothetical protein